MATIYREQMLDALKSALEGVPGVRKVDRQDIVPEMLSERQLPAIIIKEHETRYRWHERQGGRVMKCVDTIALDCQAISKRGGYNGNPSTVRAEFVWQVLNALANDATLNDTCTDAAIRFDVSYPEVNHPFARAIVAIVVESYEVFDDRETTEWKKLILAKDDTELPGGPSPVEYDLT